MMPVRQQARYPNLAVKFPYNSAASLALPIIEENG
jgi:hypothetical protein